MTIICHRYIFVITCRLSVWNITWKGIIEIYLCKKYMTQVTLVVRLRNRYLKFYTKHSIKVFNIYIYIFSCKHYSSISLFDLTYWKKGCSKITLYYYYWVLLVYSLNIKFFFTGCFLMFIKHTDTLINIYV